jgi:holo-[acyl-carrier protein] synthase
MIGIDIIKVDRIKRFNERFGDKALKKFLDKDERLLATSANTQAGFWAAKEAISKALGLGISKNCSFFDIKIHKTKKNAPYFTLSKHLIDSFHITDTALSITHDGDYAIAVATIKTTNNIQKKLIH